MRFVMRVVDTDKDVLVQSYALYATFTTDADCSTVKILCGTVSWEASSRKITADQHHPLRIRESNIPRLCEVLLGITCACLPSAAYGFRQKGTVYHRALHPSLYLNSKQLSSTMLSSSTRQRPVTADAELELSRSRIRRTTYVEISTSEPERAKTMPSPIEEERANEHMRNAVELGTLEPAHLATPDAVYRRA